MAFRRSHFIATGLMLATVLGIGLWAVPHGESRAARHESGWTLLLWLFLAALLLAALAVIYAIVRGPLGKNAAGESSAAAGKSVFPRRRSYLVLTLAYLAFTIYGSWVPFQFAALDLGTAWKRFSDVHYWQLDMSDRADWMANILLYMPLGYMALAALTVDRRGRVSRWTAMLPVVICGAGLSMAIEFTQLWLPLRTSSFSDIVANSAGTLVGAVLWLAMGQTVTNWIRSYAVSQRRRTQVDRLLEFYLVGLVIYALLPLELTISPSELHQKYQHGQIVLMPFSDLPWGREFLFNLLTDVAVFVPVGMYFATAATTPQRPVRGLLASAALAAGTASAIEVAQVFVVTRYSSTTQVITETAGALLGAAIMRRWRGEPAAAIAAVEREVPLPRAWLYLAAAGAYSLMLVPLFCAGGHWLTEPDKLRERFEGFFRMPFAALYYGTEFNATNQALRKALFFMPLGVLLALGIARLRVSTTTRRWLLGIGIIYVAGISFSIEMLKVMLPPHVSDNTSVLLCTTGAALGALMAWKAVHAAEDTIPGDAAPRQQDVAQA